MIIRLAHAVLHMLCFGLLVLITTACGPSMLSTKDYEAEQGTFQISEEAEIEDNKEHRGILDVVVAYRKGLVSRDPSMLRPLIATTYYENGSTTLDRDDDYGNERLEDLFAELVETVQEVRYKIVVQRIITQANTAHVDYAYEESFLILVGGRQHWESRRDVNRITLVRENNEWKIASGM